MSPFLPTLFTVALVEIGNANAKFSASLSGRGVRPDVALRALGVITIIVMSLAAVSGYLVGNEAIFDITQVKALLLGMALIWAAIGQFSILKPVAAVEGDNVNIIALRGYARLALSGSAGFVAFAIGVYNGSASEIMLGAALGGVIGVLVVNIPPLFFTRRQRHLLNVPVLRTIAGTALALMGFIYALTALKLI